MKISCKWLKELVDHDLAPEQVAEIITNTGLEVEEIEYYSNYKNISEKLVIGYVKDVNKHPDADKLTVCRVDIGTGRELQIICGAPNVAAGQKVVVAPAGTDLVNIKGEKLRLKEAKIRGILSEGMICAEDEISTGKDHTGIIVLPADAITGMNFKEYHGVYEDFILEVAITPNRGDAISHTGMARDLAAVLQKKVNFPDISKFSVDEAKFKIDVIIENKELCTRYSGVVVSGLKIGESPEWLRQRIKSLGFNPVNNVVDLTNFVMNETGQPLHAFDLSKIKSNKIIVKTVDKGSKFKTLDGAEIILNGTEIMICDENMPVAIGGVMGGDNSMITAGTTDVFIESASFSPQSIRRTSKFHGIATDASYRFERGSDPEITIFALKRAALLIREIAGGKISSEIIDIYPGKKEKITIDLFYDFMEKFIGNVLDRKKLKSVLQNLDYGIEEEADGYLKVSVPSYRTDVTRPVDLVEEFLRIISYEKIKFTNEFISVLPVEINERKINLTEKITSYLVSQGFYELFSSSFINFENSKFNESGITGTAIKTLNAKASNIDTLKTGIITSGLEAISYNIKRNNSNLKFFEFAKSYFYSDNKFHEKEKLGIWITGNRFDSNWYEKDREADYFLLKTYLNNIFALSSVEADTRLEKGSDSIFTYFYDIFYKNKKIAKTGLFNPEILLNLDIKNNVFFAETDMEFLINENAGLEIKYNQPCRFPFIMRDISVVIGDEVLFSDIKDLIFSIKNKSIKEVKVADVYKGEQVEKGKKSYLIRLKFQDEEKTLTDEEVDKIMFKIIRLAGDRFGANIRQ